MQAPQTTAAIIGGVSSCGSTTPAPTGGGTYAIRVFAHVMSIDVIVGPSGADESPGDGPPGNPVPVTVAAVTDTQLGVEPWWSMVRKSLGGSGSASVNAASGNLVISSQDSTPVQAHGHLAFTINRVYNSRQTTATLPTSGTIGNGWQLDVGSSGDIDSLGMASSGVTLNGDTLTGPTGITLVDRNGTRHLFNPRQTSLSVPLTAAAGTPQALIRSLLKPSNLLVAAGSLLCVDQTYSAPTGVHLGLWRYITTTASACPTAAQGASGSVLGYVTETPNGLRTTYDALGRTVAEQDRTGVELDFLYNTTGTGAGTTNVLRDVYERTSCVAGGAAANPDGGTSPTPASLGESTCRAYRFTYSTDTSSPCPVPSGSATSECVLDPAGRTSSYGTDTAGNLVQVANPDKSVTTYKYAGAAGCPAEAPANGAAALLCSATDLDGTATLFTYAADPTNTALPPVVSQITDRRGYPTAFTYNTSSTSGTPVITSTAVDAAPSTAGGCANPAIVCERTFYSGIDSNGRVAMIQAGASSIMGTANPSSATAKGAWLHSETAVWDGTFAANATTPTTCRKPDNTLDNDLCSDTIAGGSSPDETTNYTYGVNGEVLQTSKVLPGGNLDTTYGYHEQYWTTGGTVNNADYTVDGNRGVTAGTGVVTPNSGTVLFALSDHTQTLDPRGNAASSPSASAPYLASWYPDDNTSSPPNAFSASSTACGSTGAATSNTGLSCETDTPASAATNGNTSTTPKPGSCQGDPAGATVAYACALNTYDGYGQKLTMTTPDQVALGGKPYTYTYAADHPSGGTDAKTLDASYPTQTGATADSDTNAGGWLLAVTDPTGAFTYSSYDRAGNRVRSWDRDNTTGGPATSAANFDATALTIYPHYKQTIFGSLTSPWRYTTASSTALGETTSTTYDPEGRLLSSTTPRGNPLRPAAPTTARYIPQCDQPSGTTAAPVPAFTTTHCFDAAGEQSSVTLPVGNTGVGGATLPAAQQVSGTTSDTYDAYGNKITETRPKNNASDPVAPASEWTLDLINRITKVQTSRTTTAAQSPTSCPASTDPVFTQGATNTTVYVCTSSLGYDTADNTVQAVAADGGTSTFSYDAAGRKTMTTELRTSSQTVRSAVIYDADGNVTDSCPARELATSQTTPTGTGTGTCTDTTAYATRHFSTHTVYDPADRAATITRYRYVDPASPVAIDTSAQAKALAAGQSLTHAVAFDLDGNTVSSTDANSATTTNTYDPLDRRTSTVVPHQASAGPVDSTTAYTTSYLYDRSGDTLAATLPPGSTAPAGQGAAAPAPAPQPRITAYAYDADHRLTDTIKGATSTTAASDGATSADSGSNIRTRRYYDADSNLLAVTDPRSYPTGSTVPAYGAESTSYVAMYSYDPNDRQTTSWIPRSTSSTRALDGGTQDTQCPAGAAPQTGQGTVPVNAPTIPAGTYVCATRDAHDARGNITVSQLPTSAGVDPTSGLPTDNRYDTTAYTLDSKPVTTTSPDPSVTTPGRVSVNLALDGVGRTISEVDPSNGTNTSPTTVTSYNLDGTLNTVTAPTTTMYVGASGTATQGSSSSITSYDADANAISVATGAGSTQHITHVYYNSDDTVSDNMDTGGDDTRYGYDPAGNTTTTENPTEVAANPAWATRNVFTADDQLASTVTPVDTRTNPATVREVDYAYDPAGRRSVTHTYQGSEANGLGGPVTNTADAGMTTLTYLPDDRTTIQGGRTTTANQAITTAYDAAGNPTSVDSGFPTGNTLKMSYTPDDLLSTYSDATMTADPNAHTDSYSYDATGQLTARAETGGTSSRTLAYKYNDAELPTTLTDSKISSAGHIGWTYKPNGQTSSRTDPATDDPSATNDTTLWSYTGNGAPASETINNGLGVGTANYSYGYDELGRIVSQNAGSADLTGNAAGTYTYGYDTAGRLNGFGISGQAATPVSYDRNGNRVGYGKQISTYNTDNQLTTTKDTTTTATSIETDQAYAYYAWGGLKSDVSSVVPTGGTTALTSNSSTCYLYDAFDRTTSQGNSTAAPGPESAATPVCGSATDGTAGKSTSTYDGLNRQQTTTNTKTNGGLIANTASLLHYTDPGATLASETLTPAGGTTSEADITYTTAPTGGGPLAVTDGDGVGTTYGIVSQYLIDDSQGNTTTAISEGTKAAGGTLACSARFDAFGSAQNPSPNPQADGVCSTGSSPNNEWYQGARRDAAMGTYQFGARTYNPATASFTTPDSYPNAAPSADLSIGTDPLTNDTYTYVNGDPVNASDPTGHRVEYDGSSGSYQDPTTTTNYQQSNAQAHSENRKYGEDDNASTFGNTQTKAAYHAVGETQTFNLQYDERQSALKAKQAAATAAAASAAAAKRKASKHCGWAGCFLGSVGHAGLAFTDGAINGVTKTVTGGLYNPNLSNCTASDTSCKDFLKAGSVTGQVGALVAITVVTGGAGDAAVGGEVLAEAGTAAEGVDAAEGAAEAGDGAAESEGSSCPIPTNSFPGDTDVLLADGKRVPIRTLKVGQKLLSRDSHGKLTAASISATYAHTDPRLTDVSLSVVPTIGAATTTVLHTTPDHIIWDRTTHGWAPANKVRPGDQLASLGGTTVTVLDTRTWTQPAWMYDLTVNTTHTFYIDAGTTTTPVLVHNCSIDPANAGHMFREGAGHLSDTPENRQLLMDTVSPEHLAGVSKSGTSVFSRILPNGTQAWTHVVGDVIRNGGVNDPPRIWNPVLQRLVR